MITLELQPNNNLLIRITDREDFDLLIAREFYDERQYLLEMLDAGRYIGNDWDVPFNLGLTEIPAIGQGIEWDDDAESGYPQNYENLWGFPDYMIRSYLNELSENGQVEFEKL